MARLDGKDWHRNIPAEVLYPRPSHNSYPQPSRVVFSGNTEYGKPGLTELNMFLTLALAVGIGAKKAHKLYKLFQENKSYFENWSK